MDIDYKILKPEDIHESMKQKMFHLMDFYYANTFYDVFIKDLNDKTDVIILFDSHNKELIGFSTQKIFSLQFEGQKLLVLFSGDTIICREYWGSLKLSIAFGELIINTIKSKPNMEFYWMLISKGLRTYKILPSLFINYFPRYRVNTPGRIRRIMDALANKMYPENYDTRIGIIKSRNNGQYLREEFQQKEIIGNDELKNFFILNPGYIHGDELVCLTSLSPENLQPFFRRALERSFPGSFNNKI